MSQVEGDRLKTGQKRSPADPPQSMLRRTLPSGRRLKVCVIGAGVAGLRAAAKLLEHDVDVVVYEARDKVGGRVCFEP